MAVKKSKKGRIPKLDTDLTKEIIGHLEKGCTYAVVANLTGIGLRTLMRWLKRGRDGEKKYAGFYQDCKKARSQSIIRAVGHVTKAGETTWQAAAWWLERNYPKEFGSDRHEVNRLRKRISELERALSSKPAASEGQEIVTLLLSQHAQHLVNPPEGS